MACLYYTQTPRLALLRCVGDIALSLLFFTIFANSKWNHPSVTPYLAPSTTQPVGCQRLFCYHRPFHVDVGAPKVVMLPVLPHLARYSNHPYCLDSMVLIGTTRVLVTFMSCAKKRPRCRYKARQPIIVKISI